jgi:hypothetical protein
VNERHGGISSIALAMMNNFFKHGEEDFDTDKKCVQFVKDSISSLSFLYEDINNPKVSFKNFLFPMIDLGYITII